MRPTEGAYRRTQPACSIFPGGQISNSKRAGAGRARTRPPQKLFSTGSLCRKYQASSNKMSTQKMHTSASMDRLHFIATGEHLPPIAGDACPHPLEWYIKRTQERQTREHAWKSYYEEMRSTGTSTLRFTKLQSLGGLEYDRAVLCQGVEGAPITLYLGELPVMELQRDGHVVAEPTPCSSPCPKFTLRPPNWLVAAGGATPAGSPTPEQVACGLDETVIGSRLRKNFVEMLR